MKGGESEPCMAGEVSSLNCDCLGPTTKEAAVLNRRAMLLKCCFAATETVCL